MTDSTGDGQRSTDRSSLDGPGGLPVDPTSPAVIAAAFVILVAVVFVLGAATGTAAFGSHNPAWDGSADLRGLADDTGANIVIAEETDTYDTVEPSETVAVITHPGEYNQDERAQLTRFVEDGGTLVVAARDPTIANPLFGALNATVRVDGAPLRDDRESDVGPELPLVTNTTDHPYVADANGLALNHGTGLNAGNATVLARSSEFSYLDRAGVGEPTDDQPLQSHAVISLEVIGDGEVVAVSDPSVFINVMLERDGNQNFATGLFNEHETVLFDQTARGVPPLVSLQLAIEGSPVIAVAVGGGLLLGLLAWQRRIPKRLFGDSPLPGAGDPQPSEAGTVSEGDDPTALRRLVEANTPAPQDTDDS